MRSTQNIQILGIIKGFNAAQRVSTALFNLYGIKTGMLSIQTEDCVCSYQISAEQKLNKIEYICAKSFVNGMKVAFESVQFAL